MKRFSAFIAAATVLLFTACKSGGESKEEKTNSDTTAAAPPAEAVFTPFKVIMIQHKVKNYAKWKEGYLAHDSVRTAYGISQMVLGRGLEDSNLVVVIDKVSDMQKAKDFSSSPGLKDAMKNAGVVGAPSISFAEVIRNDNSDIPYKDRMMVAHHVKDFDAWLKVYDAEGKETRASFGMIDRGMARGVDDPNMVYLVFAISDMAKAKARGASPELKKIMTDAGVDGPPTMMAYSIDMLVK